MRFCAFSPFGNVMVCAECGRTVPVINSALPPSRYRAICKNSPHVQPHSESSDPTLLGNRIESVLSGLGFTKEWYAEFIGEVGEPGCMSCDKRQDRVNKAHLWLRKKLYGV